METIIAVTSWIQLMMNGTILWNHSMMISQLIIPQLKREITISLASNFLELLKAMKLFALDLWIIIVDQNITLSSILNTDMIHINRFGLTTSQITTLMSSTSKPQQNFSQRLISVILIMLLIASLNSKEHSGLVSRQATYLAAQVTQHVLQTS